MRVNGEFRTRQGGFGSESLLVCCVRFGAHLIRLPRFGVRVQNWGASMYGGGGSGGSG